MTELHFLALPNASMEEADLVILPVPWGGSVSYKGGAEEGPAAILEASEQLEFYDEDLRWSPTRHLELRVEAPLVPKKKEKAKKYMQRLEEAAAEVPAEKMFIALGGDHSVTPSLVRARMPELGTVVHLDAHADLRGRYEGSRYSHATPMYHLHEEGHRILQAGIRSIFEGEAALIESSDRIACFTDRMIHRGDGWPRFLDQVRGLSGPVYLSIDVDAFDPALIGGTGTPQPGGLTWHHGLDLLEVLFANPNIDLRGADIVELIPEPSRVSDMTAAKLLQKILSRWAKARGFDQRPENGAQTRIDYD
ncbi:agmatinase [Endothiovibrio diazotrophicus]